MVSTEPFFIWNMRLIAVIFLSPTTFVCFRSLHLTACSGLVSAAYQSSASNSSSVLPNIEGVPSSSVQALLCFICALGASYGDPLPWYFRPFGLGLGCSFGQPALLPQVAGLSGLRGPATGFSG